MKTAIITSLSSTNWSRNSAGLLRRQLLRSKRAWHCSGARSSRHCHDAEKACQLATQRQHWRMLPSHLCRLILVAPLLFIPIASQAADKRGITEKDLFDFVWIGDPQISPDGSRVAFVRVNVNEKKLGYDTAIWTVSTADKEPPHRLTNGPHDGSPQWSPDGKFLVFMRATEKDGKPEPPQLAMLSMNGGDAWTFTDLPKGRFDETDPIWSSDGAQIFFPSLHVDEPYYALPKTEIYSVAASGGEATKLTTIDMGVNGLALSPDGKQFAFVASQNQPVNSYTEADLWVLDVAKDAKPRNLTAQFDYDVGQGVFGDQAPPRAGGQNPPIWSADSKSILQLFGREGRTNLGRFDAATGVLTELTKGDQAVLSFRVTSDNSKIVCLISTPTRIGDLFLVDSNAQQQQLTDVNRELWSQLNLTEPEEITYQTFDGKKIQAWVQKPSGFDPHKKYPLILNIHGGPHAAYGWIFEHEFQWMAAKGYVVFYPNPRGSITYGQEFGNVIQYHYPGTDYQDFMPGFIEGSSG